MLDKNKMRQHHLEVTYVLGRFMTEHFIRVYKAFDGDLTAAIVLGTMSLVRQCRLLRCINPSNLTASRPRSANPRGSNDESPCR
jgi:hypothetical protein